MVSLFANEKIKKPNAAHDVRTIVNYTREINFGSAIFRLIYEKLGLDKYFAQKTQFYKLDFNLDAVVFCICFFNVEHKLNAPLDLTALSRRKCIFDFDEVTPERIKKTLEVFQLFEGEFLPYINKKARNLIKNKSQQVKHSPNSKVVLKSLAYLIRSVFLNKVADAGFNITKEPLFTLTFEGTILRPSDEDLSQGFVHVNKAFGLYGGKNESDELMTVRKLMQIFKLDPTLPMRNAKELKKALKVHFPFNKEFYQCPQKLPKPEGEPDIDLKEALDQHKIEGVDFLFTNNNKRTRFN